MFSPTALLPFFDRPLRLVPLFLSVAAVLSHPSLFGYVTVGCVGGRWIVVLLLALVLVFVFLLPLEISCEILYTFDLPSLPL